MWSALAVNAVVMRATVVTEQRAAQILVTFQALPHHFFRVIIALEKLVPVVVAYSALNGRPVKKIVDAVA